jgi:hypothetical protein
LAFVQTAPLRTAPATTAIVAGAFVLACAATPSPQTPTPPTATIESAPPRSEGVGAPRSTAPAAVESPEAPRPVPVVFSPEVAAALAARDAWWRRSDTSIAIARRGAVRLQPAGVELGLRDHAPLAGGKRLAVIEDAERPRVVTDDPDVRLVLYVDRQDARPVLLRAAPLRPTPATVFGDPPRRGHVVLQPGAWVDVMTREDSMVEVTYVAPEHTFSGWIDADVLGTTFTTPQTKLQSDAEREAEAPRWYRAERATRLLSRPGGKVIAALAPDDEVVALTPRGANGHRLVERRPPCDPDLSFVGFVRERDVYQPNFGTGHGCGSSNASFERSFGEAAGAPRVALDAGRFLLDADSPTVIGCVLAPAEVADLGDGRYAVPTIWGPVPVRLAPPDLEGRCGA